MGNRCRKNKVKPLRRVKIRRIFLMDPNHHKEEQTKHGYLYALRLLTASKKSSGELLKRLEHKGYDPEVAHAIVQKLKSQNVLNDQKLVQDTIHWAKEVKRFGRNRLIQEFKKRGVKRAVVEEALKELPASQECEMATDLAHERWKKLGNLDLKKKTKRVYDYLVNRGFDFEMAREIVTTLRGSQGESA